MRKRGKNYKRYNSKVYIIKLLLEQFFIVSKETLNIRIGRISILYELINILKVRTR
jgi:hypothetical protein